MPLTEEQKAALQTLTSADPKTVADAMKEEANQHYNAIFRIGYGTSKGEYENADGTGKLDAAKAELEAAKATIEERETALQSVQDGDVKTLTTRIETLEASNQKLTKERDEAKTYAAERIKGVHKRNAEAEFAGFLIEQGVDADYARETLVPKYRSRLDVQVETSDGEEHVTVRALDENATPIQADRPLAKLAEMAKSTVNPKFITATGDKGGGQEGGKGGKPGGSFWDNLRKETRERNQPSKDSETINRRRESLLPQV